MGTVVGSAATESVAASDLGSEMMEVDEQTPAAVVVPKDKEEKQEEGARDKKTPEQPEPTEEILHNPCRVLKEQVQHISLVEKGRYVPVLSRCIGFVLLQDTTPDEAEEFVAEATMTADGEDGAEKEPEPPEPFEWTDGD